MFLCALVSFYAWYGFSMSSLVEWGLGDSLGLPLDPYVCALCFFFFLVGGADFFFIAVSCHLVVR